MKILKFKGKMPLKNKLLIALVFMIIIAGISIFVVYSVNENAREWININILRREITEEDVATIYMDSDKSQYVYAYDKYIVVLANGKLGTYNSYASLVSEVDIQISNPIFGTNNSQLAVAEKDGQRVYLISDGKVLWENKVEGSISKINVNKSGDVSVITKGTSYKSVIITFDKKGKELFKTYLASTIAIATDISADGKNLAIAEVNTHGAVIESSIKIIDIEKASIGDGSNSVVYKYNADSNKIVINIKYQDNGSLVCIYDDSIHLINEGKDTIIKELNSNVKVADINLKGHIVTASEIGVGLFKSKTDIALTNILNNSDTIYTVDSVVKQLECCEQIVAVNLGTEVHFVGLNGWLQKKYNSVQEIKDMIIGTSVAGIIYRDRIKIITF